MEAERHGGPEKEKTRKRGSRGRARGRDKEGIVTQELQARVKRDNERWSDG